MTPAATHAITAATKRLRKAEARVLTLKAVLAATERGSDEHRATLSRLEACERAHFNRRLELEALQRERRRLVARVGARTDATPPEAGPPPSSFPRYSSGSAVNVRG